MPVDTLRSTSLANTSLGTVVEVAATPAAVVVVAAPDVVVVVTGDVVVVVVAVVVLVVVVAGIVVVALDVVVVTSVVVEHDVVVVVTQLEGVEEACADDGGVEPDDDLGVVAEVATVAPTDALNNTPTTITNTALMARTTREILIYPPLLT